MSIRKECNLMISRRYFFLDISSIKGVFSESMFGRNISFRKFSLTEGETIEGKPDGRFR